MFGRFWLSNVSRQFAALKNDYLKNSRKVRISSVSSSPLCQSCELNQFSYNSKYNFHRSTSDNNSYQQQNENCRKWSRLYGISAMSLLLAGSSYLSWKYLKLLKYALMYSGDDDKDDDDSGQKNKNKRKYSNMNFIADIVEQVSTSVVYLESHVRHPVYTDSMVSSSGSGFVVDKTEGVILTNAHVIANSTRVMVKFNNGRTLEGVVEFVDDQRDLATVRIPSKAIQDVDVISLGDSKRSRAGEWVIAVGAPFSLSNTVTVGVISSISRAGNELGLPGDIDYIQTDASINIGNSGGPLLNLDGEAIGINTLKVGEGISFAIPSDSAAQFLRKAERLRHQNSSSWFGVRTPHFDPYGSSQNVPVPTKKHYLGLTMITLTPKMIEGYRARDRNFPDVKKGVLIYRVVLGSPAHMGDLRTGDIIQSVNGKEINRPDDVYKLMETTHDLNFCVRRGDEQVIVRVQPAIITE